MYTYTQRNTYKNKGTGPVEYIQDEKVLIMFSDYNKFGDLQRFWQAGLNLKCLGNFS